MTTTTHAAIRLAILDSDSGFLQVLTKRLGAAGWQHRVLASPVPLDTLVAMRLNAVDIGEQVAFVVTGLFREFEDASHPDQDELSSQTSR